MNYMFKIASLLLLAQLAWGLSLAPEGDTHDPQVQPRRAFDGCKLDPSLRFGNNVFYKCSDSKKADDAALSISPPGSRHSMCHDPHKPQKGFYAHYHPAGHSEVDGFNYHFHWGSEDFGLCPWNKKKTNYNRG